MWDNYSGLSPIQPFQPEFVVIFIRKYVNGTILASEAEIFSSSYYFAADNSDLEETMNWYQCNDNFDFMFATIDKAYETCRKSVSTIKTYYSQVLNTMSSSESEVRIRTREISYALTLFTCTDKLYLPIDFNLDRSDETHD